MFARDYWSDDPNSPKNVFGIAESIADHLNGSESAFVRIGGYVTNSPYGVSVSSADHHYTIKKIGASQNKWIKIIAYDVRTSDIYSVVKRDNSWLNWNQVWQGITVKSGNGFTEQYYQINTPDGSSTEVRLLGSGTILNFSNFLKTIGLVGRSFKGSFGIDISNAQTIYYNVRNKFQNVAPSVISITDGQLWMNNPWIYLNVDVPWSDSAITWETMWEFGNIDGNNIQQLLNNRVSVFLSAII